MGRWGLEVGDEEFAEGDPAIFTLDRVVDLDLAPLLAEKYPQ